VPDALAASALGLLVALGCGLLIGLERERRKGEGDDRQAAGIRSFTVAALCGGLAQSLAQPALVATGALLVALLATLAYFKSRSRDPGLTTELALFATYLIGVQAVASPALGAASGAGLAVLLAVRQRLHRFATRLLSEAELRDALLLAALGLVVLPLISTRPLPWLGGINPRPLAAMVLLILLLQAAGHVALRLLGAQRGLAAAGFFSGFVSSTATIASFGARSRRNPELALPLASGAVLSTAATWVQALLIALALSPPAASALAPLAVAGLLCALVIGALLLALAPKRTSGTGAPHDDMPPGHALRLREALLVAIVLSVVILTVTAAQQRFGQVGLLASVGLAGLADAHAPVASLAALFAGGGLARFDLVRGVLLAVTANSTVRILTAFASGGSGYGLRVAFALALELAAAWSASLMWA